MIRCRMPYDVTWEPPRGVYRRYHGRVTIAERRASFDRICADPRFDALRYTLTDALDVQDYEVEGVMVPAGTNVILAFGA